MKTVWVLERFVGTEETEASIADLKEMLAEDMEDDTRQVTQHAIAKLQARLQEGGYWLGYVGRSNYRDWCWDAKDFIRRHKGTEFGKAPLRVVKAQIPDSSRTWVEYTNAVVNEGVLKYLYATL